MPRPLRVQSQQLLTERQVFKDEVLPGPESADHPPEEMPKQHNHGENLIRIELCAKVFILQAYYVLARDTASEASDFPERSNWSRVFNWPRAFEVGFDGSYHHTDFKPEPKVDAS